MSSTTAKALKYTPINHLVKFGMLNTAGRIFSPRKTPLFPDDSDRVKSTFNPFPNKPWFLRICRTDKSFEIIMGKGEIAINEQFLFFSTVFSTLLETFFRFFLSNLILSSANSFSLEVSKICRLGQG